VKDALRAYRFATAAQWNACLFAGVDADARGSDGVVRPLAPYARPGTPYAPGPAFAPAVARGGELLWRDDAANLWRLRPCDDAPESTRAPLSIAAAKRIVVNSTGLWVAGSSPGMVECFENDSLTRLLQIALPAAAGTEIAGTGSRVVDLADAGRGGVFVLVERAGGWEIVRIDCAGHLGEAVPLTGIFAASELVYLRVAKRFVVLAGDCQARQRLSWFTREGGAAIFWLAVAALHPCFTATALGSDGRSRIVVAGSDGTERSQGAYVLSLDADGNPLGEVPLDPRDAPASGVAASRAALVVTGPRGLLRFAAATAVPDASDGAGEVRCTLVTPMLLSPDREDARRWLRIEATADLPEGTTLEVSFAATDDVEARDRLLEIAADESLPASRRMQRLLAEPEVWRPATAFHGDGAPAAGSPAPCSAPLFDVRERWLWAAVTLRAAPGAALPALSRLAVLYPGRSLMEHLPAVYQRAEAEPGSFLRALVGVLEATTQDLDGRIAAMARGIHPASAPPAWLDFVARWLGVPWDDGLDEAQKRALLLRAPDLARGRGTRAGLEALLEALLDELPEAPPGSPRRFRVVDPTADLGFATVGGDGCAGSALPAILAGPTPSYAALGSARLGALRLPCAGQVDDPAAWLASRVRVDVAATAEERRRWEPWLYRLVAEMVPVTVRLDLRWVSRHALRDDRLDGTLALESTTSPRLGTDAITGLARLPERAARVSSTGASTGLRLQ
jgi:phage tail-like protein